MATFPLNLTKNQKTEEKNIAGEDQHFSGRQCFLTFFFIVTHLRGKN